MAKGKHRRNRLPKCHYCKKINLPIGSIARNAISHVAYSSQYKCKRCGNEYEVKINKDKFDKLSKYMYNYHKY